MDCGCGMGYNALFGKTKKREADSVCLCTGPCMDKVSNKGSISCAVVFEGCQQHGRP